MLISITTRNGEELVNVDIIESVNTSKRRGYNEVNETHALNFCIQGQCRSVYMASEQAGLDALAKIKKFANRDHEGFKDA